MCFLSVGKNLFVYRAAIFNGPDLNAQIACISWKQQFNDLTANRMNHANRVTGSVQVESQSELMHNYGKHLLD